MHRRKLFLDCAPVAVLVAFVCVTLSVCPSAGLGTTWPGLARPDSTREPVVVVANLCMEKAMRAHFPHLSVC